MAAPESYAIKIGQRILVTGANSFVGSNVIDVLLSLGYTVRGTVRSERPWLNELFDNKYGAGKFETVVVPSLDDKKRLLDVLAGISGVIHVASDVSFDSDAGKLVPYVVNATETVMQAASEIASVKRVVLTSSSVAAVIPEAGHGRLELTQDTWNDASIAAAWDPNTPAEIKGLMVYAASKTAGERAAFDWVKKHKPGYVLNSVLPDYTIGEVLHPNIGSSGVLTALLLEGNDTIIKIILSQYFVDAKDLARLHVIALLNQTVTSERLFGLAGRFEWKDVIDNLRELRPSSKKLVTDFPPARTGNVEIVPTERSKELLRSFFGQEEWTSLKDSLDSCISSLDM
ncbi:Aldehyde 2 [Cyphellophora attinorum]|uniref:Aldehyde 2 n=1 Tax=Cyphellophora attinorum TaxID=1664694 RepID=A0A0N0NLX7_9EURO|nr:Aldehyde 2 [Phialophora attinorum]KPI39811.1 Aldehyde 2 [Phialophora attinorum]